MELAVGAEAEGLVSMDLDGPPSQAESAPDVHSDYAKSRVDAGVLNAANRNGARASPPETPVRDSSPNRSIKPIRRRRVHAQFNSPYRRNSDRYVPNYSFRYRSPRPRVDHYRPPRSSEGGSPSNVAARRCEALLVRAMADLDVTMDGKDDRRDRGRNRGNKRRRDGQSAPLRPLCCRQHTLLTPGQTRMTTVTTVKTVVGRSDAGAMMDRHAADTKSRLSLSCAD